MKRLGILGGTFDPPHLAHLILAEAAREQLGLDKILFMPAGQPPHKPDHPVTPALHRLAMTGLATADNPWFAVDDMDVNREPPHYTATLLPMIRARYGDVALWLLLGGDSLRDLPTWYRPAQVLIGCRLAVLPRPDAVVDWDILESALPNITEHVDMLTGPTMALSGTALRQRARAGGSLRYLVTDPVRRYIIGHELYRDETLAS